MFTEEKIADGIYISKGLNKQIITEEKKPENSEKKRYVFGTTTELITLLEGEFEELMNEVALLYNANEEMSLFDPTDYDLIEAREDNLVIINKRLVRLQEIQGELKLYCPTNPLVLMNVFDYFIPKNDNNGNKVKENNTDINKTEDKMDVITEIDL